jgi:hypothetical protein
MFTLMKLAFEAICDRLAVPWEWFTSLPLIDWQMPLTVAIILVIFYRRIIVNSVMARYAIGDWVADQKFNREWNHYARMNAQEFRKAIGALEAKSKREEEAANRLDNRARQGVRIPGGASSMYQEARRRRDRSLDFLDEIQRLKELRAEIEKQKAMQGGGAKRVIGLMNKLSSRDHNEAASALAELNQLGMAFDWNRLIPANLPERAHEVLLKTLRLMASTSNVNEAQTAYAQVLRTLESHRMTWRDMAA